MEGHRRDQYPHGGRAPQAGGLGTRRPLGTVPPSHQQWYSGTVAQVADESNMRPSNTLAPFHLNPQRGAGRQGGDQGNRPPSDTITPSHQQWYSGTSTHPADESNMRPSNTLAPFHLNPQRGAGRQGGDQGSRPPSNVTPSTHQHWNRGGVSQVGEQVNVRSSGTLPSIREYLHGDIAPRRGDQGQRQSSGPSGGNVPARNRNNSSSLGRKPTAELLALNDRWKALLEDQRNARRSILTGVREVADELSLRGEAWDRMSTSIDDIGRGYENMDRDVLDLMTRGVRPTFVHSRSSAGNLPSAVHPTSIGRGHGAPNPGNSNGSPPLADDGTVMPVLTRCCGKVVAAPDIWLIRVPRTSNRDKSGYHLRCINCNEAFRDHRAIYTHFPGCVDENGNLTGAYWFDHESIDVDKIPESLMQKRP
ncbi:hypothetical protein HO173_012034 [Letharia columbiana]|uniref:Uncharacterized protein n=1 Tax=Letharia columbiana TaxID=112416 RepID=A0A8H6FH78_9LECA|nr:uncharacterized protein HO173_012034 [Letharia columbiana]KAF6227704.1 hypothetical protein HO173_012034 [Letharia columbiana]